MRAKQKRKWIIGSSAAVAGGLLTVLANIDGTLSLFERALSDEAVPVASVEPSEPASSTPLRLDVPGGGGYAELDLTRHSLTVCDTNANGRGVSVDFTIDDRPPTHIGDANGSQPPCREQQVNGPVLTIRICEADSPADTNPVCTTWQKVP